ncbi:hypothetical protein ACLKA6_011762 [Drosophila palustris]
MWSKLFIILLLVHYLSASCDICQSGRAACHSENTYSICIDGVPTRNDITCPVGYTCTGEKFICYKKSEGYKPICISGDTDPTDPSSTPGSTTEDTDFKAFCTSNGDGPFTNESDPTCKTYIYCFDGIGKSAKCLKINSKETWFNGQKCDLEKPVDCS